MAIPIDRRQLLYLVAPALSARGTANEVQMRDTRGEKIAFSCGERPLFDYRYSASRPKTYVHPFYAPNGAVLTRDGPSDEPHHRGIMLAWSDVKGVDFWGELNPGPPHGPIAHQRFESIRRKPLAGVTGVNHWIGGGEVILIERQTVRAPVPAPDITWLEWESELRPARGEVTLSAKDHPYDGLGIRFVASMDGGGVLNANGSTDFARASGEPAAWCAYHGKLDQGGTAGVAIFNHPENPRHPSAFFVMNKPFGYLSAAPTFRDPFKLSPGQTLHLRYAVLSFAGEADRARLDGLYKHWSKHPWNRS